MCPFPDYFYYKCVREEISRIFIFIWHRIMFFFVFCMYSDKVQDKIGQRTEILINVCKKLVQLAGKNPIK